MNKDLSLRKIKASDKKYFAKWWRDKDLIRLTSGNPKLISDRRVDKYFSMMKDKNDHHFMIILGKKVIGHIALIKKRNNWYETIIIIGEKEYWNKGYGTKVIKLVIQKAKRLGISKIYLEVRPTNKRAIRVYEKCGFRRVAIKKHPRNKYLPLTLRMELRQK